jgi:hypothetical protein
VPNNASAWNYLHGLLDYARMAFTHAALAELYVVDTVEEGTDDDVFDLENPLPSKGAELPCVAAIDGWHTRGERGKDGVSERIRGCEGNGIESRADLPAYGCHTV